jgi:gluconolactonase
MFALPQEIATSVFASVPEELRKKGPRPAWYDERPHAATHSFLEGPSFDREGYLYCVDMPYGRIFRISPEGSFSVVADYDGEPNGLRIHKDGRVFIADRRYGVMVMEPGGSTPPKPILDTSVVQGFRGLNDLTFAGNGDLYFTDQGETGLHDPAGSLYRLRANGKLEQILTNLPGPNGLALNADDSTLYLNMSRTNTIWSVPLHADGRVHRVGIFIYLSGSTGGPDGLAPDAEGGLAVAHSGLGTVWLFSKVGEPTHRIRSCEGTRTTNLAYGGIDRKTLFITESHTGSILQASVPVAGRPLFSHA